MDIYEKYGLKPVINAGGKMRILGVSQVSDQVAAAQKQGAQNFFEMAELTVQTGCYLADLIGSEDALIVNSASAGIAQVLAGIIGRGNAYHVTHPYTTQITQREVIMPLGHDVDYGAPVDVMLAVAGAKPVLAGYANRCTAEQLAMQITPQTVAILYIKSHHTVQKSMLSIADALQVAHDHQLPLVLDAAAEGDLRRYLQLGVDVVIYSGAKAISGPASGLVLGRQTYVEWARQQNYGIGRAMKIGKENILGLVAAVEQYLTTGPESGASMKARLAPFIAELQTLPNVQVEMVQDGAGRDIFRASVRIAEAAKICQALRQGRPAIYPREYRVNEGLIEFDIRALTSAEMTQIVERLRTIIEEESICN